MDGFSELSRSSRRQKSGDDDRHYLGTPSYCAESGKAVIRQYAPQARDFTNRRCRHRGVARAMRRVEFDREALTEAAGLAAPAGTSAQGRAAMLAGLRAAILKSDKLRLRCRVQGSGTVTMTQVLPHR